MSRAAQIRERLASESIPYSAHVSPTVLRTYAGDYVFGFAIDGLAFESTDDAVLNRWHETLNQLWRQLATDSIALWSHTIRRRDHGNPLSAPAQGFAAWLDREVRRQQVRDPGWINEHSLTIVYRPPRLAQATRTGWLRGRRRAMAVTTDAGVAEALEVCGRIAGQLLSSLARVQPRMLGLEREPEAGQGLKSTLIDLLARLVNGETQRLPLVAAPINEWLATSRILVGREAIEYRTPTATRLGAMLGIKEYPPESAPGMLNRLLAADFGFVLTQSFLPLPRSAGLGLLARQQQRFQNAGDLAISQAAALGQAMDHLAGGEYVMGEHHLSLQVLDEPMDAAQAGSVAGEAAARQRLQRLNDLIASARTLLGEAGFLVAREDLALEAAFWAQLPGNFSLRPRRAPLTSRNFAGLVPFHQYPVGAPHGHHWGEAIAKLDTAAHSPYYLSLHAGVGGGLRDTGHSLIVGPTGTGKTVLLGYLAAQLTRFGATQVFFDKDRGLEILVRALGGEYRPLRAGVPTGMNPLALPPTAANLEFLREWLRTLVRRPGEDDLPPRDDAELDTALRGTLALPVGARRLSRLIEFLDPTDLGGLAARLARWCASSPRGTVGEDAWVFDQAEDRIAPLLAEHSILGFDVTDFLGTPRLRVPVALYLFHLTQQLMDGRRLVVWMDEFSRLLDDPAFTAFAKDGLKTWRKRNALAVFATQSVSDILASRIARTLVEQTATQILYANPGVPREELTQGLGLSDREAELVREQLSPASRQFLLRQGGQSVVARLPLDGVPGAVPVLSGRTETVILMERLRAECGEDPACWIPYFMAQTAGVHVEPANFGCLD